MSVFVSASYYLMRTDNFRKPYIPLTFMKPSVVSHRLIDIVCPVAETDVFIEVDSLVPTPTLILAVSMFFFILLTNMGWDGHMQTRMNAISS